MSMPAGAWADEALLATRFRGGEFLLPLTEGLFGATAPPITRYGRPLRVDSTLFTDVGPQVVHDCLGFTVHEGVPLAGEPVCGLDRFDERRVVAGSLLANQVGSATAENPVDLHAFGSDQRDLVLGLGDLDEGLAGCVGRQRFQR